MIRAGAAMKRQNNFMTRRGRRSPLNQRNTQSELQMIDTISPASMFV